MIPILHHTALLGYHHCTIDKPMQGNGSISATQAYVDNLLQYIQQ